MKRYLLFAALACLLFAGPLTAVKPPPNIVLIVTDDEDVVGFQDALDHGLLPDIKTRMVDVGWTAENAFTPESECCPARAMLLKGQYPQNTHVISNHAPNGIQQFIEATSLPVWQQSAGYKTMLTGKYMNEYGILGPAYPASSPRSAKHVPLGWTMWQGLDDNSTYTSYAHTWTVSAFGAAPTFQTDTAYQTDIVSIRFYLGVQWLIQQGGPWYAEMTPVTPHFHLVSAASRPTPIISCPGNSARFGLVGTSPARYANTSNLPLPMSPAFNAGRAGKPEPIASGPPMTQADIDCARGTYNRRIEQMRAVNDAVHALYTLLDSTGQTANTIVCLTSDNGHMLGEYGLVEKVWAYERSLRVPLVCAGPRVAHRSSDTLVTLADLTPTFVDLAGATTTAPLDGRSLRGDWSGLAPLARYAFPFIAGDSTTDGLPAPFTVVQLPQSPFFGVRTKTRKAIFYTAGPIELYHLDTDPYELVNVAGDPDNAAELSSLATLTAGLITCSGSACAALETVARP